MPSQPNRQLSNSSPGPRADRDAHREWIGGAITTLLSHYWQDRRDELVAEAVIADWMDDLEGFPAPVIYRAISDWRRSETKRPAPAALIALCRKHMPKPTAIAYREIEPGRERCSPEQAERNRALIAKLWPDRAWPTNHNQTTEEA